MALNFKKREKLVKYYERIIYSEGVEVMEQVDQRGCPTSGVI